MKTIIFLLISATCFSQQKDTTHKDTAYAIVLNILEYNALINLIKITDEKPSVIKQWIEFIGTRTQVILPPKNK